MGGRAAFGFAAIVALLLTGCYGPFGKSGVSVPSTIDDTRTVSDAADALVAHRSSATDNARAAIGVTNSIGSFVRDISRDESTLRRPTGRAVFRSSVQLDGTPGSRIFTASQLLMRPGLGNVAAFCESGAGMGLNGIASLDASFGWQSGAYAGGTRTTNGPLVTWSATETGAAVEAPIGQLGVLRHPGSSCPMMDPTFTIDGARQDNAFTIPISLTYRNGKLWDVSVNGASFADGERVDVTSSPPSMRLEVTGTITKGDTELGSYTEDAGGEGTLTVTSTGAQYRIKDWIVVGI